MNRSLTKTAFFALAVGVLAAGAQEASAGYGYNSHYGYYYPVYPRFIKHAPVVKKVVTPVPVVKKVVQPVPVSALRFVDLRLVDPGIPGKLGPRFRLFFKNFGFAPSRPFDVILAGTGADKFDLKAPQVLEHVSPLKPGQLITIDMRLPFESMLIKYSDKPAPAPFTFLFVMIGGQKDLLGAPAFKKLVMVPRLKIRVVDLSLRQVADPAAPEGAVLTLNGEGFGAKPGQVIVSLGGLKLHGKVMNWGPLGIQVQMPLMNLAAPGLGNLTVIRGDGLSAAMPLKLLPVKPVIVEKTVVAEKVVPGAVVPVKKVVPGVVEKAVPGVQVPPQGGQLPPQGGQVPPQGGQVPPQGGQVPPQGGQAPPQGGQAPPETLESPQGAAPGPQPQPEGQPQNGPNTPGIAPQNQAPQGAPQQPQNPLARPQGPTGPGLLARPPQQGGPAGQPVPGQGAPGQQPQPTQGNGLASQFGS